MYVLVMSQLMRHVREPWRLNRALYTGRIVESTESADNALGSR